MLDGEEVVALWFHVGFWNVRKRHVRKRLMVTGDLEWEDDIM